MLAIILSILKIAGLLLLGILGLVLLILLIVLLVPIRYRAEAEFGESEKLHAKAAVSWLLHIISLQVTYDKEADICVRIFGIRLGKHDSKKKQKKRRKRVKKSGRKSADTTADQTETTAKPETAAEQAEPEAKPETAADQTEPEAKPETAADQAEPEAKPETAAKQAEPEAKPETAAEQTEPEAKPETAAESKPVETVKKAFHLPHPIRKIRVTFRRICDKLKAVRLKKEAFLEFINREENRQTFRLIKRQVIRLLKHILPRKLQGMVRFGFDDPYMTGQALACISPFYGIYARKLQLIPVFEGKTLEGNVRLKGRIRIGTLLVIGIRIFFDQNFRTLLKQYREK